MPPTGTAQYVWGFHLRQNHPLLLLWRQNMKFRSIIHVHFFPFSVKACSCMNCLVRRPKHFHRIAGECHSGLWSVTVTLSHGHYWAHRISIIRFDCLWQKIHDIVHNPETFSCKNKHADFQFHVDIEVHGLRRCVFKLIPVIRIHEKAGLIFFCNAEFDI